MSSGYREFDDFASGSGYSSSDPALSRQLSDVATNVQHFCKNVSTLENKMADIDTRRDTPTLREEIIHLVSDTVQLAKITNSSVKKFRLQSKHLATNDKIQFDSLMTKFASAGIKFQRIQKMAADLEQEMITKSRIARQRAPSSYSETGSITDDKGDTNPFAQEDIVGISYEERARQDEQRARQDAERARQDAQLQALAEADAALLETRHHEMRQLEHDIVDINDIFRDLGTMVNDQGELVDHIEANVEVASARVERGNEQLRSAASAKRRSRKLTVVIVVIIGLVVVAVIIIILIILAALGVFTQH